MAMEIANPKRILALAAHDRQDDLARFLGALTGTTPEPSTAASATPSLAGTSHVLPLTTSYYTATVPVWLDLVADATATATDTDGADADADEDWAATFLAPEARESSTRSAVSSSCCLWRAASRLRGGSSSRSVASSGRASGGGGGTGSGSLSVSVPAAGGPRGRRRRRRSRASGRICAAPRGWKKMGIHRVLEALEANDWDQGDIPSDLEDELGGLEDGRDDPESLDFGVDRADFEGLRQAIWGLDTEPRAEGDGEARGSGAQAEPLDEAAEVEKLESMMRKLQAVRDMSAGLPEEQRKKMAAKAVNEVMKDL
ncbi:conserved hypothetical protein [Verticillium alfalfae VaMs.102]|uniref:Alpha and gamma adaptin binding protein p34 n=1 Tax=Verticillium alfalfae (strain VaMs.102 / ATCC MYA-4576 / FGSC 10136) TaxID=526221 RepID=C9SNQ6_VERA1|nr:conserved hypothetical protein [Verticillium alfalfae VaMs.102]EEY20421.1 conserved hypothetical protein [Verticillium alfalfae VaMs.102]